MKKHLALLIALLLALTAGCARSPGESAPSAVRVSAAPSTAPVSPEISISPEQTGPENKNVVGWTTPMYDFEKLYPDVAALCAETRAIVVGEVTDVVYTFNGVQAITEYEVKLEDVWESEKLAPGDTITVVRNGGYISGDVFKEYNNKPETQHFTEDDVIVDNRDGTPFPEPGDRYLLFLDVYSSDNRYYAVGGFMGLYNIDGGSAYRNFPDAETYDFSKAGFNTGKEELSDIKSSVEAELKRLSASKAVELSFRDIRDNFLARYLPGVDERGQNAADYEAYAAHYDRAIEFVRDTAEKAEKSPRVLILGKLSPLEVYGGDTFTAKIIELAGGVNCAEDVSNKGMCSDVTLEQIKQWNPEFIFLVRDFNYTAEALLNSTDWQDIEAVKLGRVFTAPNKRGAWLYMNELNDNTYVGMGALFVLHYLYPELYSYEQLKEDAMKFYELEWVASNKSYTLSTEKDVFINGWNYDISRAINETADSSVDVRGANDEKEAPSNTSRLIKVRRTVSLCGVRFIFYATPRESGSN